MKLTRGADYAVRVMVHLAGLPAGERATRDDLAAKGQVPEHFLSKILQALTKGGLVVSHRGVTGGYAIARHSGSVTLLNVVELIDGPILLNVCLAANPGCDRSVTCPVHRVWVRAQEALKSVLGSITLEQLAAKAQGQMTYCGGEEWN